MPANADEIEFGVIVALPAEARGWSRRDTARKVVIAGIGRERARRAAEPLLERGADSLLGFGVCGGLSSQWRSGDLLLPRRVVADEGEWRTHDVWRARLSRALPDAHEVESIYCSDAPVISRSDKRRLAMRGFAAVDMESAGVAQAATHAGVPFAVLKAVCDPAERAVPAWTAKILDSSGALRWPAMFGVLGRGPRAWREVRLLRRDFAAARASLRCAAQNLSRAAEGVAP